MLQPNYEAVWDCIIFTFDLPSSDSSSYSCWYILRSNCDKVEERSTVVTSTAFSSRSSDARGSLKNLVSVISFVAYDGLCMASSNSRISYLWLLDCLSPCKFSFAVLLYYSITGMLLDISQIATFIRFQEYFFSGFNLSLILIMGLSMARATSECS